MAEGLFFDLGDTLVDLSGLVPAMAEKVRARFPTVGSRERVALSWVTQTAQDTHAAQGRDFRPGPEIAARALGRSLRSVGIDLSLPESLALVHSAWEEFLGHARFHEDATAELFKELRSRVRAMGIITDSDTSMVRPLLEKLGAFSLFDVVVVSDTVGAYKPDPRIYHAALEKAGVPGEDSVFVSDSLVDLEGGRKVGMRAIWIDRDPKGRMGPDLPGVTAISSLTELLHLVPGTGDTDRTEFGGG